MDNVMSVGSNEQILKRIIDSIQSKIGITYSLSEGEIIRLNRLIDKYGLNEILDAIKTSARQYLEYQRNGLPTQESIEEFLYKMQGILIIRSRGIISEKISYVKGVMKKRSLYINEYVYKDIFREYIKMLKSNSYTEEEIVDIFDKRIIPLTREVKNWSTWRWIMEDWIDCLQHPKDSFICYQCQSFCESNVEPCIRCRSSQILSKESWIYDTCDDQGLESRATIMRGNLGGLKLDSGYIRVWLSDIMAEDDEGYNSLITLEELDDNQWSIVSTYKHRSEVYENY